MRLYCTSVCGARKCLTNKMPKFKVGYDLGRVCHSEWEKEYPWVSKAKDGKQAYCKVCTRVLQPRKGTLKNHENSKEHKQRVSSISSTRMSVFKSHSKDQGSSVKIKKAELQLAVAVSCHCPVAAIDHLGEIVKINSAGSTIEKLQLHRTKCSKLITNVIKMFFFTWRGIER